MIIVDGSNRGSDCQRYVSSLLSDNTEVHALGYNIGHGRGMHFALERTKTRFAVIFDSDIVMLKSPVVEMLKMFTSQTYGVGYLEKTAYDGYEYGSKPAHRGKPFMMMLHPFFQMLQVKKYFEFHRYVHHGAPCYKAALDIHKKGLTDSLIKEFPGLHHTSGRGWNWEGKPSKYIQHDTAGTRNDRRRRGLPEIVQGWEVDKPLYRNVTKESGKTLFEPWKK